MAPDIFLHSDLAFPKSLLGIGGESESPTYRQLYDGNRISMESLLTQPPPPVCPVCDGKRWVKTRQRDGGTVTWPCRACWPEVRKPPVTDKIT